MDGRPVLWYDLLWKVLRPKSLVRVKPQRDGDQKTPKTPLRGSRSSSRTRATPSTVTAPTEAFASQGTDKVATCDGEAVGAEAAPVKPTDVILEPAEIAERENMNETGTSAEVQPVAGQAGQIEASGDSAIPPCSADPAHATSDAIRIDEVSGPSGLALDQQSIEAVAVAVPSIAASLLQEVAEVGKRPISAETVEQAVAGPEEKIGDSETPIEAQHEATAKVAGGSRLPSCDMATLRFCGLRSWQGCKGLWLSPTHLKSRKSQESFNHRAIPRPRNKMLAMLAVILTPKFQSHPEPRQRKMMEPHHWSCHWRRRLL